MKRRGKEIQSTLETHRKILQRETKSMRCLKKQILMMKRELTFKETRAAAANLIEQTMVRGAFLAVDKKIKKAATLIAAEASNETEVKKEARRRSKLSLT